MFQSGFRIRIHPDPLHLVGSGSGSTISYSRIQDPDPDPQILTAGSKIRIRIHSRKRWFGSELQLNKSNFFWFFLNTFLIFLIFYHLKVGKLLRFFKNCKKKHNKLHFEKKNCLLRVIFSQRRIQGSGSGSTFFESRIQDPDPDPLFKIRIRGSGSGSGSTS